MIIKNNKSHIPRIMRIRDKKNRSKIIAIIPARGGSRGVPNKNIRLFCGKPLIYYTIAAAKKSKLFDKIVVSTNSVEIMKISKKFDAEAPYLRPKYLAKGNSNVVDAVIHLLDYFKIKHNYKPDTIFLLQPTSPLRGSKDIVSSYEFFQKNKAMALVSVCKTHHQIFHIVNNKLKLINKATKYLINRQEFPDTFKQDGSMIYIINTKTFIKKRDFLPPETFAYIIPEWKAVDIDREEDFLLAEVLYKNKKLFKR